MAFEAKNLQITDRAGVAGATGQYVYREGKFITADAAATVEAAGYFNSAANRLPVGTVIHAVTDIGGTPKHKTYIVTTNTGSVVTIALQTAAAG